MLHLGSWQRWWELAKDFAREVDEDHVSNGAAALAFYFVLAIFPAAIFGLSLLPYLPIPNLQGAIMDALGQALPPEAAQLFRSTVENVVSNRNGGLLSFGFVFTLWSASTGIYALMQELNVVYGVKEGRSFLKARGLALLLTLLFFAVVVITFALVVFGGLLQDWLGAQVGSGVVLLTIFAILRWVIIVGALLLAFALVYYLAPNADMRFRLISPGSVFATIGMLVASIGFRIYVSNFASYGATYGSLGTVIVLMMWLFITGWVVLLGAEINDVLDRYRKQERSDADRPEPQLTDQRA